MSTPWDKLIDSSTVPSASSAITSRLAVIGDTVDTDRCLNGSNMDNGDNKNNIERNSVGKIFENGSVDVLENFNTGFSNLSGWSLTKKYETQHLFSNVLVGKGLRESKIDKDKDKFKFVKWWKKSSGLQNEPANRL
ncbi:hypothetical protein PGB90_007997 [Kerria lacca]